jgi:ribosomal protein L11 methyltransferase
MIYCLRIHPDFPLEKAWSLLESLNVSILYGTEEDAGNELYASIPSLDSLPAFDWIMTCTPHTLPSINWESQWAAHGHNFHDGYVHVDLSSLRESTPSLRLEPGPGFGDLSHPTTPLVLRMLAKHFEKQTVIDIGCGSGILALAAAAMGAPTVYGIDIAVEALEHARQNAKLNLLEQQCHFCLPSDFVLKPNSQPIFVMMNMIQSEQQLAWSSLSVLHGQPGFCLTSGILKEEREEYLALTSSWGWSLLEEHEDSGWLGFIHK